MSTIGKGFLIMAAMSCVALAIIFVTAWVQQ